MPQIICPYCGKTINLEKRREIDRELILNALESGPKTFTELHRSTYLPRKTLSIRLKNLCANEDIIKKDGYYHLNGRSISKHAQSSSKIKTKLSILSRNTRIIALIMLWLIPTTMLVYALMTKQTRIAPSSQSPIVSFSITPAPQPNIGWEIKEAKIIARETTVVFNASSAYDPDGEISNYIWDFGDGCSSFGMIAQHVYSKPGRYTVKLTVFDDEGKVGVAYKELTVYSRPVARIYLQLDEFSDNIIKVKIAVVNVSDLYGWQLGLSFNATALNCLSFEKSESSPSTDYGSVYVYNEGIFTYQPGSTLWFPPEIDNEQGLVYLAGCTLIGDLPPVSGSGTLARVTFKILTPSVINWNIRLISVILGTKSGEEIPVDVDNTIHW